MSRNILQSTATGGKMCAEFNNNKPKEILHVNQMKLKRKTLSIDSIKY